MSKSSHFGMAWVTLGESTSFRPQPTVTGSRTGRKVLIRVDGAGAHP
jgi:hypothetical protein